VIHVLSEDGVALTGVQFERRTICNVDVTAPVMDHARALHRTGYHRQRGPTHAEHLAHAFLGDPVMSLTLGYFKRRTGDAARALERTAGGTVSA